MAPAFAVMVSIKVVDELTGSFDELRIPVSSELFNDRQAFGAYVTASADKIRKVPRDG